MKTYRVTVHIVDYYGYAVYDEEPRLIEAESAAEVRKYIKRNRPSWPRFTVELERVKGK